MEQIICHHTRLLGCSCSPSRCKTDLCMRKLISQSVSQLVSQSINQSIKQFNQTVRKCGLMSRYWVTGEPKCIIAANYLPPPINIRHDGKFQMKHLMQQQVFHHLRESWFRHSLEVRGKLCLETMVRWRMMGWVMGLWIRDSRMTTGGSKRSRNQKNIENERKMSIQNSENGAYE